MPRAKGEISPEHINKIVTILRDLSERIRLIEERLELTGNEVLDLKKTVFMIRDATKKDISETYKKYSILEEKIDKMIMEIEEIKKKLDTKVSHKEFMEVKKYLTILNPLYGLTEYDVRKIVREEIEKWLKRTQEQTTLTKN